MGESNPQLIFGGVKYYLSSSLSVQRQTELSTILDHNGAISQSLERATHVITNTHDFEGYKSVSDGTAIVSEEWVDRSITLARLQPVHFYSTDPAMIFSGVVACATGVSPTDIEVLSAGITALGGQWRNGLTRDVTHLFALSPGSVKYNTALHYQKHTGVSILLPHWFDDAMKLAIRGLPTAEYEWPDPRILKPFPDDGAPDGSEQKKMRSLSGEKKTLYQSALWTPGKDVPEPGQAEVRDIWKGRRILLSPSLELVGGRREAVEAGIKRTGGAVVKFESAGGDGNVQEETRRIDEADILVTRYRAGTAYVKAVKAAKTIGTLNWLFHVESTGVLSRPTDQLLHYPTPKKPIENFSLHEITVTNYTGDSREYLKKLIVAMGAKFTPSMSGRNTVVIAAYIHGNKTEKARSWSIPIVNHTWLEDCFVQWRNLTVGIEKYITFPPRFDFAQVLAERGVGRMVADDADLDLDLEEETPANGGLTRQTTGMEPPAGTEASAKDANEVEEAMALVDGDGDALMDGGDRDRVDVDGKAHTPARSRNPAAKKATTRPAAGAGDSAERMTGKTKAKDTKHPRTESATRPKSARQDRSDEDEVLSKKPSRKLIRRSGNSFELDLLQTPPSAKRPTRQTRSARKDVDGDDIDIADNPGPSTRKRKAASSRDSSEVDAESEVEILSKTQSHAAKSKPRSPKKTVEDEEETDDPPDPVVQQKRSRGTSAKGKEKAAPIPSTSPARPPKRVLSVMSPAPKVSPTKQAKSSGPSRTESLRVVAYESSVAPSPKRGRPAAVPKEKSLPLTRTPSKRTASNKATEKLRDEIMPDVMNYQQEMKKSGRNRGRDSRAFDQSRDSVDPGPSTGKKKQTSDATDAPPLSSDEEGREKKKRRVSTSGTSKKSTKRLEDEYAIPTKSAVKSKKSHRKDSSDDEESDSGAQVTKKRSKNVDADVESNSRSNSKALRVMTTGVTLDDDVIKHLTKLGVKMTTKPAECTHLVTKHIGRTEKLLCAMAVSPFIISDQWATASAAAKQLLTEDDYILRDPANEKKYGFKLADALRRGKKLGGQLFAGKVFYVTPRVKVDSKLLKNVVVANGGQLLAGQTPTIRILSANTNRRVLSCPEDASIWRPLVQNGYPIYSTELVLTGALKQEVDWDNSDYKVPGSY